MSSLTKLKWYCIDFDGTLADALPDFAIGDPIEENIEKLRKVHKAGYSIIIYTARHWEDYIDIEDWLLKYNVPFKTIICGKPLAHRYVDDRNIHADSESWLI
jgi:hydroxymethylpyrimidine pyrophosphatase-like HAD family hydrolase